MSILSRAFGILVSMPFNAIGNIAESIFYTSPRRQGFDADFLKPQDVMSRYNHGFTLTGNRSLTRKESHMHSLIAGGSGAGKTSTVILPTIYNIGLHEHSMVIHDPSGELFERSAPFLHSQGYEIKVLNFADGRFDGFNPIPRLTTKSEEMKLASMLARNGLSTGNGTDSFWNNQAAAFISLLIAILKVQEPQYQNLANLKHLLDSYMYNPAFLEILVAKSRSEAIVKEYKIFLKYDPKVSANLVSTARAALQLLADEGVQLSTSFDSIHFPDFRTKKVVLYIKNKTADSRYYAVLSSLFFESMFSFIMERIPDKRERSIFFIMDELTSLQALPTLETALSNFRKFSSGIMLVVQAYSQIQHLYGNHAAEAMKANTFAKVYFPNQPIETCRELETLLGKYEYVDKEGRKQTRPLLVSDEIRTMEENTSLILINSKRAVFANMKPYFRSCRLKAYSKYPMLVFPHKNPYTTVPLIK